VRNDILSGIASDLGLSPAQVALAWTLSHVRENRAAADVVLDESVLGRLDAAFSAPRARVALECSKAGHGAHDRSANICAGIDSGTLDLSATAI